MADRDLDPMLPYLQVARGAEAQASLLAPLLSITPQHAFGAMCLFWRQFTDRRILGRHLPAGEILVDRAELVTRLALAFGMPSVDPTLLATAGFLEPRPDGRWRVRGGSRMLSAEAARLKRGGGSHPGGTPVEPPPDTSLEGSTPVPPPSDPPSHPPEERGERREVREDLFPADPPEPVKRAKKPRAPSEWETLHLAVTSRMEAAGHPAPAWPVGRVNSAWKAALDLVRGWASEPDALAQDDWAAEELVLPMLDAYLANTYWAQRGFPLEGFLSRGTLAKCWARTFGPAANPEAREEPWA